jgi:hypothetical protein
MKAKICRSAEAPPMESGGGIFQAKFSITDQEGCELTVLGLLRLHLSATIRQSEVGSGEYCRGGDRVTDGSPHLRPIDIDVSLIERSLVD